MNLMKPLVSLNPDSELACWLDEEICLTVKDII